MYVQQQVGDIYKQQIINQKSNIMKIKINQKLLDVKDKVIILEGNQPLTLKEVIVQTMSIPFQGDTDVVKYQKYDLYKLVKAANDEVELTIEDIAFIKKWIGTIQPQLIAGQCRDFLEEKQTN